MKKLFFLGSIIAVLFLGSCSITQEYHFNKNLSGNYSFEMKMGDFINMMQSMDTTGNFMSSMDTLDHSFNNISKKYDEAGAKNVKVGWKDDKTTIFINFEFANIDDLNNILEKTGKESTMGMFGGSSDNIAKFSAKGKRNLYLNFPEIANDTISSKDLESMKNYISMEMIFSFDRRIKSIDNKNATLSDDKKSFKFSGKLDKLFNKDFTMDTNVKLKFN